MSQEVNLNQFRLKRIQPISQLGATREFQLKCFIQGSIKVNWMFLGDSNHGNLWWNFRTKSVETLAREQANFKCCLRHSPWEAEHKDLLQSWFYLATEAGCLSRPQAWTPWRWQTVHLNESKWRQKGRAEIGNASHPAIWVHLCGKLARTCIILF